MKIEHITLGLSCIFLLTFLQTKAQKKGYIESKISAKPLTIPIGLDAYRQWDKWPLQRTGVRAYMRSTYDRSGGNEGADASHFLFMKKKDRNVTLDISGKGILYFFRANHWHGSPWHFTTDGENHVVKETATADPVDAERTIDTTHFIPAAPFAQPLGYTWSTTKGADLIWTPIPFEHALQIAYSRTHYGTGYSIYHLFANEEELSHPIRSWDINKIPDKAIQELINQAGTDIAPQNIKKISGTQKLNKGKLRFANIQSPPSVIRAFKLVLPLNEAIDLERLRILVTWDDAKHPSIDAPLCLFFGAGTLYNRDKRKFLIKGFPINIRYDYAHNKVTLACYYPMPFFKSAQFEIAGIAPQHSDIKIDYEIRYAPWNVPAARSTYFHATYRDFPQPKAGKDLTLLDTRGVEGHKEWSGNFVGTSFIFSHRGVLNTLEGDPRFFFDDSQTPQAYGTGTEEWAGGGDYWGGQNMTLPFAGHPCGAVSKEKATNIKDRIESGYRFLLADLMPFGKRAVIHLEHGGENLSKEHYETVTYWYGLPAPSLTKTDELDIGNLQSEKTHQYYDPQASDIQKITSRYEWGIDTFPAHPWGLDPDKIAGYKNKTGKEVYPSEQKDGRYTRGTSSFTVTLRPDNHGALLRRTLDYSFPNQKAKIYIADTGDHAEWHYVGIWYLAGSNTCVYSNPKGELDQPVYKVETSDRRFRDDEFLLPARLTKNHSKIRIKVVFVPTDETLYAGVPFPKKSAWSALNYEVFSYILPAVKGLLHP